MFFLARPLHRCVLDLLLLLPLAMPLRAQLDTRLQGSPTDLLDMYQQNATTKVKPEVLTLFDFSGSMATLMFHPQYVNNDLQDADENRYMTFALQGAGTSTTTTTNTYTVTATGNNCGVYANIKVTVAANGTVTVGSAGGNLTGSCGGVTGSTAPTTVTDTAYAYGNSKAKDVITFTPASTANSTASNSTPYTLAIGANTGSFAGASGQNSYQIQNIVVTNTSTGATYSSNTSIPAGTKLTITITLDHLMVEKETSTDDQIVWNGTAYTPTETTVGSGVYVLTATYTIPTFTYKASSAGTSTTINAITPSATSSTTGSKLTFTDSFSVMGTNTGINWTITSADSPNNTDNCGNVFAGFNGATKPATVSTSVSASTGTTSTTGSVYWMIDTCVSPITSTASLPYVKVTLDASQGAAYSASAYYAYVGALSAGSNATAPTTGLVRPDGSMLTANNFQTYTGSLALDGSSYGKSDVRNWIRQASHVRFSSGGRTIDIPIPWNIGAYGSTAVSGSTAVANPVTDQVITDLTSSTPAVGSGNAITFDTCYQVENQTGSVFTKDNYGTVIPVTSSSSKVQTTVVLYSAIYRPAYISWLFNGKYSATAGNPNYTSITTLQNHYIVFDAATPSLVPLQGSNTSWGQAFGPATATWGNITIPAYNSDGSYNSTTPSTVVDASSCAIPALTRAQAVKKAAITTWIAQQDNVYWAYRFLDATDEAINGTASSIDNNSHNYNVNGSSTMLVGGDSCWNVLNNTTASPSASVTGMKRIASMFAAGNTPLTYGIARSLAQYTDPTSVFNAVESTSNVNQCQNSFLILFTDGIDNNATLANTNNPNLTSPYISGDSFTASTLGQTATGNQSIIANESSVETTGKYWNLFTYAGIGAHLGDSSLGGVQGKDYLAPKVPGSSPNSGTPDAFLPFAIQQRNGVVFSKPHLVTTMTVGVSLGGQYTNSSSPKYSLFLAALVGDPLTPSGTISGSHAFVPPVYAADGKTVVTQNDWVPKTSDPNSYPVVGQKNTGAVYFFDATDPTKLLGCLKVAMQAASSTGGNNATANPNLPYIGAMLGSEAYLGQFTIPQTGGAVWSGDLVMYPTRQDSYTNSTTGVVTTQIDLLDSAGAVITTNIGPSTAMWSASTVLAARAWSARKLFTRIPVNANTLAAVKAISTTAATQIEPGLSTFSDQGTPFTAATTGLVHLVATTLNPGTDTPAQEIIDQENQQAVIQNAMGGNTSGVALGSRPVTTVKGNRSSIMGDIIDSSPAAQGYTLSNPTITAGLANHSALTLAGATNFRIVLAGTNEGWLHAFGELSKVNASGATLPVTAVMDELWAFMPTDFLANLDQVYGPNASGNRHRFMVDGTPSIYFLDLPPSGGGSSNGVLDNNGNTGNPGSPVTGDTSGERAIAIIGLGKGGRSYYALDIRDPFNPSLLWSLVPDEAAYFPDARNKTTNVTTANLQTLIGQMGFSTCTPGIGRVLFNNVLTDVVFLGGGLSVPAIEQNFGNVYLGRTMLALDVYTGNVLAATSLPLPAITTATPYNGSTTPGPIVAGMVPFEFILNSGMAQRAYFNDRSGGLWSWGSEQNYPSTDGTYPNFRIDSSDLAYWTTDGANIAASSPGIRKVYQDGNTLGAIYTTLPAPFRVGNFPGLAKDGSTHPATVGIAMESGDRFNPVDEVYYLGTPDHFRLTVAFDRQDSRAWSLDSTTGTGPGIVDSHLANFTGNSVSSSSSDPCSDAIWEYITPGCSNYYLAPTVSGSTPKFGFYVNFASGSTTSGYLTKGITSPTVVSGSLYYSTFLPTAFNPCTGGEGNTVTSLMTDVYNPLVSDTRSGLYAASGVVGTWSGLASTLIGFGTRGVVQGGVTASGNVSIQTYEGSASQRHPKVRVWRSVQ